MFHLTLKWAVKIGIAWYFLYASVEGLPLISVMPTIIFWGLVYVSLQIGEIRTQNAKQSEAHLAKLSELIEAQKPSDTHPS